MFDTRNGGAHHNYAVRSDLTHNLGVEFRETWHDSLVKAWDAARDEFARNGSARLYSRSADGLVMLFDLAEGSPRAAHG